MKFCLIGPVWPYRGGISQNSAIIAKALVNDGHEVLLISFRRQYPQWLYPGQTDQDNSQHPMKANAEYILDPFLPYTWKKAADLVFEFKPNLVMIQWWTFFWSIPFAYISRTFQAHGLRVAYMIHNVTSHEAHPLDRLFTRLALSSAHDFLVFSELEKQKLQKLLPDKRIVQTCLPVYSFDDSSEHSKISARKTLNLPDTGMILLFFGFVRPYKGLDILLKALIRLKDKGITPYLAIVGEFWKDKQYYLDLIRKANMYDQIRIEDRYVPNEEADLWFKGADVLIAPYTHGVTQSAVASLALGYSMPMIITTQVAQGLAKNDHQTVQVVPQEDVEALESEIEKFIKEYTQRDNLSNPEAISVDHITEALIELANYSE